MAGVDIRNINGVIERLDALDTPFYSVHAGKELKFFNKEDGLEEAKELLRRSLELFEESGTATTFTIKYYSGVGDNGKFKDDDLLGSNTFRLNPAGNEGGSIAGNYGVGFMLQKIQQENEMLKQKIEELENEETEAPEQQGMTNQIIAGLLQDEQVKARLLGGVFSIIDKLFSTGTTMQTGEKQIAGTGVVANSSDNEKINYAIGKLLQVVTVDDLVKLADFPEKQPTLFNMLLTQLRANG